MRMRRFAFLLGVMVSICCARADDGRSFEHEFSGLTFDLPPGWRAPNPPAPAGFLLTSPRESRDDPYIETVVGIVQPVGDRKLAELLEINKQQLLKATATAQFFDDKDFKVGSEVAHRRGYTASTDKGVVQVTQVMILRDSQLYMLTFTTTPSEYGSHENMFDSMIDTLRFGPEFKRVTDILTGITVELPRDWSRKGAPGNGTIVLTEPPSTPGGASDAFANVHSLARPNVTIADLRARADEMFKKSDPTANIIRVEDTRAGRVEGIFVEVERTLGQRRVHSYSLFLPFNGRVYTVEIACNNAAFAGKKEFFERVMKTVRLRGDNEKWSDPATGFHVEIPGAWQARYGQDDVLATFTAPPESRTVPTTQRVMVVTEEAGATALEAAINKQIDDRKQKSSATMATPIQKLQVSGIDARSVDLDLGKDAGRLRIRLLVLNRGDTRFLITFEATDSIFGRNSGVYDEIIQSIRFD